MVKLLKLKVQKTHIISYFSVLFRYMQIGRAGSPIAKPGTRVLLFCVAPYDPSEPSSPVFIHFNFRIYFFLNISGPWIGRAPGWIPQLASPFSEPVRECAVLCTFVCGRGSAVVRYLVSSIKFWLQIDVHANMLYEAILVYAQALRKSMDDGHQMDDGRAVMENVFNGSFRGILSISLFVMY